MVLTSTHFDTDGDGPRGEELIVGGNFRQVGGMPALYVAAWDGKSWKPMDTGMPTQEGNAFTLCAYHGKLYAGGAFYFSDGFAPIIEWNGTSWARLSSFPNSYVNSLVVYDDELIAGGEFSSIGPLNANQAAAWNGTTWRSIGAPFGGQSVKFVHVHDGLLYIAGLYSDANLKAWNGTAWSNVSGSQDLSITAIAEHNGDMIVASGTGLKKLSGLSLVDSGFSFGTGGNALYSLNGTLYAGGKFVQAGSVVANGFARWDGTAWSAVGTGISPLDVGVRVIDSYDGKIVVGGYFAQAGPFKVGNIARTDGTVWVPGADSTNNGVLALQTYNGSVVAAGKFTQIDQTTSSRFAGWAGNEWVAMPGAAAKSFGALEVYENELYAGVQSSTLAPMVQKWNGSAWSMLPSDISSPGGFTRIYAMKALAGKLYFGGEFTRAGALNVANIAAWNGIGWESLGSGLNSTVQAIAVYKGQLVAGGAFTLSGSASMKYLAQWTPSGWQPFSSTTGARVTALLAVDDSLYVSGPFLTAGNVSAVGIARWDGVSWSALGKGLSDAANAMAMYNGSLIAGGKFATAGDVTVNGIARWDGASWSAFGGGMGKSNSGDQVYCLATVGPELLVGGSFPSVDGRAAVNLARWSDTGIPWITTQPASERILKGSALVLTAKLADNYSNISFQWRRNGQSLVDGPGGASIGGGTVSGSAGSLISPTLGTVMTLTIAGAQPMDTGDYSLVLSNPCGGVESSSAAVVVQGCATDLNGDAVTDDTDFQFFVTAYDILDCADSKMPAGCAADFDGDGLVNDADFSLFVVAYDELVCPAGSRSLEP